MFFFIWFVGLLALRPLLAYCAVLYFFLCCQNISPLNAHACLSRWVVFFPVVCCAACLVLESFEQATEGDCSFLAQ
jgi:hypothetical protein